MLKAILGGWLSILKFDHILKELHSTFYCFLEVLSRNLIRYASWIPKHSCRRPIFCFPLCIDFTRQTDPGGRVAREARFG